jgi:hypothetical protein
MPTRKSKNYKEIDHLPEDDIIPSQRFVCLSFLSPEGIMNCKIRGLKVRGVFPTKQEADDFVEKLKEENDDFDIFVGEVGKWLAWDSSGEHVEDEVYREEKLQELAHEYKKNRSKAKKLQKERKTDAVTDALQANMSRRERQLRKMKKTLAMKKKYEADAKKQQEDYDKKLAEINTEKLKLESGTKKEDSELQDKEEAVKHDKDLSIQEGTRIKKSQHDIVEKEEAITDVNETLTKMQALYNKIKVDIKEK